GDLLGDVVGIGLAQRMSDARPAICERPVSAPGHDAHAARPAESVGDVLQHRTGGAGDAAGVERVDRTPELGVAYGKGLVPRRPGERDEADRVGDAWARAVGRATRVRLQTMTHCAYVLTFDGAIHGTFRLGSFIHD